MGRSDSLRVWEATIRATGTAGGVLSSPCRWKGRGRLFVKMRGGKERGNPTGMME
jgi:hypothetical protein